MAFINEQSKEINCKLVYFGPPFCGKSTSLKAIAKEAKGDKKGDLVSLSSNDGPTLFFDFVPLVLGKVKDFTIRLHLYTVPGQATYEVNRKIISKGADGIVFVADSQVTRMEANLASLKDLRAICEAEGLTWGEVPMVMQYNKRDLPQVAPLAAMRDLLNTLKVPDFETVATKGDGVFDTLKAAGSLVLRNLRENRRLRLA